MKPFLQRECIGSMSALRLPGTPVAPAMAKFVTGAGAAKDACDPEPQVDVVKEGDRVVRLVVTCGCGERVEIDCLYTGGA